MKHPSDIARSGFKHKCFRYVANSATSYRPCMEEPQSRFLKELRLIDREGYKCINIENTYIHLVYY